LRRASNIKIHLLVKHNCFCAGIKCEGGTYPKNLWSLCAGQLSHGPTPLPTILSLRWSIPTLSSRHQMPIFMWTSSTRGRLSVLFERQARSTWRRCIPQSSRCFVEKKQRKTVKQCDRSNSVSLNRFYKETVPSHHNGYDSSLTHKHIFPIISASERGFYHELFLWW